MSMEMERKQGQPETGAVAAASSSSQGAGPALAIPEDALIIVPVRNMVLFPGMILPLNIGRESSIAAAQQAVRSERPVGLLSAAGPGQRQSRTRGRAPGRHRRADSALRDDAGRRASPHLPGTGALRRARVPSRLSVSRRPRRAHHRRCAGEPGHRSALHSTQEARGGGARASAADADGAGVCPAGRHFAGRPGGHGRRLLGHQACRKAADPRDLQRREAPRPGAGAARRAHRGAQDLPRRSTSAPRPASISASASSCCASR